MDIHVNLIRIIISHHRELLKVQLVKIVYKTNIIEIIYN